MSRRDTIIIAILVNTCLLAVLFILANGPEDQVLSNPREVQQTLALLEQMADEGIEETPSNEAADEVDQFLQQATQEKQQVLAVEPKEQQVKEELLVEQQQEPKEQYLNITVKRGDALEKIARANRTTVSKIRQLNGLKTDTLVIGKVLRVPVPPLNEAPTSEQKNLEAEEAEYYTIREGDNPWKIAKKFDVRFSELLELNHLDEAKARRLRAGDKLRVR